MADLDIKEEYEKLYFLFLKDYRHERARLVLNKLLTIRHIEQNAKSVSKKK